MTAAPSSQPESRILRAATSADAAAIAALHAASWRSAYRGVFQASYLDGPVFAERQALWEQRLATPSAHQCVLLAEQDSAIVGFACAFGDQHPQLGTYLDNLHVRPGGTGQGLGARLLRATAQWSLARFPAAGMYLSVLAENAAARRFYAAHGAALDRIAAWTPPGGGSVDEARYVWSVAALRALA